MSATVTEFALQNPQHYPSQVLYHGHDLDSGASNANSTQPSPTPFFTASDGKFSGVSPNSFQPDTINNGPDSTRFQSPLDFANRTTPMSGGGFGHHASPDPIWLGANYARQYPSGDLFGTSFNPGSFVKHEPESVQTKFGQITPPVDNQVIDDSTIQSKKSQSKNRRESDAVSYSSKRSRHDSKVSVDDKEDSAEVPGKREKYREKNRVAAAKCRAKKKENVDILEDDHRTQSALNSALKQSEQTLRDLSLIHI